MKTKLLLSIILVCTVSVKLTLATEHVILFGVDGFSYIPSALTVNINDVIIFRGNFSSHPLSSTSVPSGASSFSNTSGSTDFSYTASVAGTYNYQCNFHVATGMIGTLTVEDPSSLKRAPLTPGTVSVYPTATNDFVNVDVSALPKTGNPILLELYTLTGQQLISEQNTSSGIFQFSLNGFNNGIYFLAVKQDGILISTKRIVKR